MYFHIVSAAAVVSTYLDIDRDIQWRQSHSRV